MNDDRGDIILGWLAKVVVTLALLGLLAFDLISIGWTKVSLTDQAESAARSASATWAQSHNVQKAYDAALAQATEDNAANTVETDGFTIDKDGTVHLRLDREAQTIVVSRVGPIRDWGHISVAAAGRDVTG